MRLAIHLQNLGLRLLLPCLAASLLAQVPNGGGSPAPVLLPAKADPEAFPRLPRLLVRDTVRVVTRPADWEASDWKQLGLGAVAVLGAGLALDAPLDRAFARNARPAWANLAKNVEFLGGTGSLIIAGGVYLGGAALKNPELRAVGIDAGMAMVIAQLALTMPLKVLVGRSRPSAGEGSSQFKPLSGGQSFPSGHTTQAFVLASVISAHADQPWVTGVSYSLATLVGVARMERRAHFLSDVLGGAAIGTFVGREVVHFNQSLRSSAKGGVKVSFQPVVGADYQGATLRVTF